MKGKVRWGVSKSTGGRGDGAWISQEHSREGPLGIGSEAGSWWQQLEAWDTTSAGAQQDMFRGVQSTRPDNTRRMASTTGTRAWPVLPYLMI